MRAKYEGAKTSCANVEKYSAEYEALEYITLQMVEGRRGASSKHLQKKVHVDSYELRHINM